MRFIILAMGLMLALYGCTGSKSAPPPNTSPNNSDTNNAITESMCNGAGGNWNTQGTCCRDLPEGTPCTKLCVAVCECGGIAGFRCPAGFTCTDYYPDNKTADA